jgi:DNA-binding CsgD family transcriptional regulator
MAAIPRCSGRGMGKAIYVVGPMKLQNSLMAAYFEQATGIRSEAIEDASHIPGRNDGIGGEKRLILWDCMGSDLKVCLPALSTNGLRSLGRDLLGLFNLQRGNGVEEESLAQGVRGFFYQGDSSGQFLKGVQAIFEGELWLSRKIMTHYILNNHKQSSPPKEHEVKFLTPREKEILTLIAQGASNDMIADKLCISRHTVKTHLYNIFKKILVPNRLQAALWAVKNL